MQTVYYNRMRNLPASLLLIFVTGAAAPLSAFARQQAPTMRTATMESHEGMTIGVDPWTQSSRYKEKFGKKSPFSGGVVALRVSFRNDTDESIKVDLQRIRLTVQLEEDNRQELAPLTPEDVADTVLLKDSGKDPTKKRNPLPIPAGKPTPGRDKNWTELKEACQNAGVPSNVIAAHSSMEGLVYFDIRGEVDLLQTARLYFPNMVKMTSNEPLSYFDIDLGHSSTAEN
jgi:hypothetical protein